MTGDTLKRVRSIRRWLEKAEKSYDSDKKISGELNLIMAQAEMQRLKEADPKGERRRVWGFRIAAFCAALAVIGAASFLQDLWMTPAPSAVSASESREAAQPVTASTTRPEPEEAQPAAPARSVEESVPAASEEAALPAPAAAPAPAPVQYTQPAAPVMSQQEIQSVVGEAGRALRGQS